MRCRGVGVSSVGCRVKGRRCRCGSVRFGSARSVSVVTGRKLGQLKEEIRRQASLASGSGGSGLFFLFFLFYVGISIVVVYVSVCLTLSVCLCGRILYILFRLYHFRGERIYLFIHGRLFCCCLLHGGDRHTYLLSPLGVFFFAAACLPACFLTHWYLFFFYVHVLSSGAYLGLIKCCLFSVLCVTCGSGTE